MEISKKKEHNVCQAGTREKVLQDIKVKQLTFDQKDQ